MIYRSNGRKVLNKLVKAISPTAIDALARECATTVLASNLRRIHNDGLTISLRKIGQYGTSQIYINANTPIKITPLGKPTGKRKGGKSVFKNGKKHTSRFFKGGYKEYRYFIKKESGFVNLQIRGTTLKANYRMVKSGNRYLIGFITAKSVDVAEGMEKKYNARIWGLTKKDIESCGRIVHNYIRENA